MMYHTENETTVKVGQATATVLAHSISPAGAEIVTWELVYPRYIHPEFLTHRVFSRNSASSRATPTKVYIEECRTNPVFFDSLAHNQKGMVGGTPLSPQEAVEFEHEWNRMAELVANTAEDWSKRFRLSKQIVNRIMEPFLRIRTLLTTTDLDSFFKQRDAEDAQPEMKSLAVAMKQSLAQSKTVERETHLPYADTFSEVDDWSLYIRVAAACARVCVMRGDGRKTTLDEDKAFCDRLWKSGHLTPFEHIAFALPDAKASAANLRGWESLRHRYEQPVFSGVFEF